MSARVLALTLLVAGCGGPASPPPRAPAAEPAPDDAGSESTLAPVAEPTPPPGPCAVPSSIGALLHTGEPGILLVDAAAPRELGACVSRPLVLREGQPLCDPSGLRCRIGERHVLLAREQGEACVPIALVAYPGAPPDVDPPAVEAALAMRDEACTLHDRVVRADDALYADVTRARRIAPAGRRGELGFDCLIGDDARALASEVRRRFTTPLRCEGLRCVSESDRERDDGSVHAPPGSLLFAHRLAGPLRFDGVAWLRSSAEIPRALELLRRRCR